MQKGVYGSQNGSREKRDVFPPPVRMTYSASDYFLLFSDSIIFDGHYPATSHVTYTDGVEIQRWKKKKRKKAKTR